MKPVTIEEVIDAIYDASVIVRIRKYGIAPPDGWVLVPTDKVCAELNESLYKSVTAAKDKP